MNYIDTKLNEIRILNVGKDQDDIFLLKVLIYELTGREMDCFNQCTSFDEAMMLNEKYDYNLIIVYHDPPSKNVSDFFKLLNEKGITSPVIVLGNETDHRQIVSIMKGGASDYLDLRHLTSSKKC